MQFKILQINILMNIKLRDFQKFHNQLINHLLQYNKLHFNKYSHHKIIIGIKVFQMQVFKEQEDHIYQS